MTQGPKGHPPCCARVKMATVDDDDDDDDDDDGDDDDDDDDYEGILKLVVVATHILFTSPL